MEGAWEPRAVSVFACEQVIAPLWPQFLSLGLEEVEPTIFKLLPSPAFCLCQPLGELQSLVRPRGTHNLRCDTVLHSGTFENHDFSSVSVTVMEEVGA